MVSEEDSASLRKLATKAKDLRREHDAATRATQQQASRFKRQHLLVVAFFSWIFALHCIGIYFFTKGFLLTRLVLEHKSQCAEPPIKLDNHGDCWLPKTFDRAVVILIDALRYDFTVPTTESQHYLNALTVCYETALQSPENAVLLPFIADPPTTTLQRLKALTTGTLPTFIEAGSNFAGTAIDEDNLIAQLLSAGKTVVHLGDDTWESLFPGYFDANLSHPFDSFDVPDLHTVDNGVMRYLFPLLKSDEKWDVIIGHYLGVDHAGHRYGPDHPQMTSKLEQMDKMIRDVVDAIDDKTLLVVMGDHGMDTKGDHGGESDDEVEAALWMYSKTKAFGRTSPDARTPPSTAKTRPVNQIDLVPTLALLLGLPIPFNNLGAPIAEAFIGSGSNQWQNLASAQALAASQIRGYQNEYEKARGLDEAATSRPKALWDAATGVWNGLSSSGNSKAYADAATAFKAYQAENLSACKSLFARFDVPSMGMGIGLLSGSLILVYLFARPVPADKGRLVGHSLMNGAFGGVIGLGAGALAPFFVPESTTLNACLFGLALGSLLGNVFVFMPLMTFRALTRPWTLWGTLAFIFTMSQSVGFASNSYTIWEDEILLFFLGTFATIALAASLRQASSLDRFLGVYHSVSFLVLTRLGSLSRLCREEQMPSCRSTYYASANASTSATWQLFIPFFITILLPEIIKTFYTSTRAYQGSAPFWVNIMLRIGFLGVAGYATLEAADNGDWLDWTADRMRTVKVLVAQLTLAFALGSGISTFYYAPPCVQYESTDTETPTSDGRPTILVKGYLNAHGARYGMLVTVWLLAIALVQKPMGIGALGLMVWQIFALLELISIIGISKRSIGPVILGLLGNFYFFKTGHQATLASIQWDSAFVAVKTLQYPWSPLLVMLNSFGPQILAVIAAPLIALWRQSPRRTGLLGDVSRALAAHMMYYAVINLATTMWAGHLRRHLMLYRIFSPRFLTGAAVLVVVDLIGILVALVGFRWNMVSVAEVFGWK